MPCQQYLQSSWSVCSNSVVLGTGQGSVAVKLPKPSAVANFTATPRSITSSEDAARLNPLLVATSSRLSLAVAFDDGVVRDFSTDRRVVYGVAQGSMCEVIEGKHMFTAHHGTLDACASGNCVGLGECSTCKGLTQPSSICLSLLKWVSCLAVVQQQFACVPCRHATPGNPSPPPSSVCCPHLPPQPSTSYPTPSRSLFPTHALFRCRC